MMIHYKFIGYIEIPECGSNYKADTRKGVAVGILPNPHKTKEQA